MTAAYAETVPLADVQGTLPLSFGPRHAVPEIQLVGRARPGADVVPIDRRRRSEMEAWTARFVQAAVEIVGGDRPVSQLLRWTSERVYGQLQRRADYVARAAGRRPTAVRSIAPRPKVASVHACFIDECIVEAAARIVYGERSRALAARFERLQDRTGTRWVCTALDWS